MKDQNREAAVGVAALATVLTAVLLVGAVWASDYTTSTRLMLSGVVVLLLGYSLASIITRAR